MVRTGINQSKHSRQSCRRPVRRSHWPSGSEAAIEYLDFEPCYRLVEAFGENTVAVVKQIFVLAFASDGLAQLLHRPSGSWMGGDVAMDEAPAAMFDHHKHV